MKTLTAKKTVNYQIVYGIHVKLVADNKKQTEVSFPNRMAMVEFIRDNRIAGHVKGVSSLPLVLQGIAWSRNNRYFKK